MGGLSESARQRLRWTSEAAFTNPFSPRRDELDRRIAETDLEGDALLARAVAQVRALLEDLAGGGTLLDRVPAEDRALVEHALWFETFHRFRADLDALIDAQLAAGDAPVAVPFAAQAQARLVAGGVPPPRARRIFEFFYQLQRAHRFVSSALTGDSPSMVRLREALWNSIFTYDIRRYERFLWNRMEDFSTILLGETGTGKGAAAAAIGRSGFIPFDAREGRFQLSFTRTFTALNLSEFPASLIESELFGHSRGAFTGAIRDYDGAFGRTVAHGVLFLDEIGEIAPPIQVKLLSVLQERTFTRVGSHEPRRFEGRVIAATHRSLPQLRAEGRFRDDLYYRLCSNVIEVPPLRVRVRERPEELRTLIRAVLARVLAEEADALVDEVHDALRSDLGPSYPWPGNVRELEQHVRSVLLTRRAQPHAAGGAPARAALPPWTEQAAQGRLDATSLVAAYCRHLYDAHGSYADVARVTGLDRRTVKKHIVSTES